MMALVDVGSLKAGVELIPGFSEDKSVGPS